MGSIEIRPVRPDDLDAVYAIALKTGANGEDATAAYTDPRLVGHVYAAPYVLLAPECAFVVEDGQGTGGYIVGAPDTRAFEARLEAEWWPALRPLYPDPAPPHEGWSADERMAFLIHHPFRVPSRILADHPSHLHVNLLPRLQGRGVGSRLMGVFLARMKELGSRGVHLGVGGPNTRGRAFYAAYGFTVLEEGAHTVWCGIRL